MSKNRARIKEIAAQILVYGIFCTFSSLRVKNRKSAETMASELKVKAIVV